MQQHTNPGESVFRTTLLTAYSFLAAGYSAYAIATLARIPAESENVILLGFSAQRLTLFGFMLLSGLIFLGLGLKTMADKEWRKKFLDRLGGLLERKRVRGLIFLGSMLGAIGGVYFILLGTEITEPFTMAYFVRLKPFAVWIIGLSVQTLIALPFFRYGRTLSRIRPKNSLTSLIAVLFGIFLLIWGFIAWTKMGLVAENVGWNRLGAPILETQAFLAWAIGMGFLGISLLIGKGLRKLRRLRSFEPAGIWPDLLMALIIWLSGAILWSLIPLAPSWFVSGPRPPNFEIYPNSDASLYDITGQNALVGVGFKSWGTPFAVRPMYALFLGTLHLIGGLDYEPIIILQVAVLALLPVIVYWLTKLLSNRLAAIIAAALINLREANAIVLTDEITVSNSKLLMSDLPAALGIALVSLITASWLQRPDKRPTFPLIVGGLVGFFMLIRPEVGGLLPFIGLITILILRRPKRWLISGAVMGLGVTVLLFPWIWRNWQITGRVFLDLPNYRSDLFAQRYSPSPAETEIEIEPGESTEEFNQRMTDSVVEFAQKNPNSIAGFIFNHYFNSQIQTVLMFPSTGRVIDSTIGWLGHRSLPEFWQQCCSAESYVRRLPFWWQWDGTLPNQSIVPVLINLFILSVGLGLAWKRHKLIGALPLIILFAHLLINAAVRNSGGRYILPVDWVTIVYYSVGLAQITLWGIDYFTNAELPKFAIGEPTSAKASNLSGNPRNPFPISGMLGVGVLMLLIGWTLPITERAIAPRYSEALKQERILSLFSNEGKVLDRSQIALLKQFMDGNGSVVLGRALYPRFHKAGQGEPGSTWPSFYPRDFPRISFHLVGPDEQGVILAYEKVPETFPHASDVLAFGCPEKDYFDALAVVVYADRERIYLRSPLPELVCPLRD